MEQNPPDPSWKLKLRYGLLKTPFHPFFVIGEGEAGELSYGYECRPGSAWMSMKVWAASSEESADMLRSIGNEIGFTVTGRIMVYEIEPEVPPTEEPTAYNIEFSPFNRT